jgi:hypothetical protein
MLPALLILVLPWLHQDAAMRQADSDYVASIYLVTHPGGLIMGSGTFYDFNGETLTVRNFIKWLPDNKKMYDTTHYFLSAAERLHIVQDLQSIDTLKSTMVPCIMDGLIFHFASEMKGVQHSVWISNAYNDKIFLFVDIINSHVAREQYIHYNRNELINKMEKCRS